MYVKNEYCVQVRTPKGWRYYTEYNRNIDKIYNRYLAAKKKYKQTRIVNITEVGIRVANIY